MKRETLKEAGYEYKQSKNIANGEHILYNTHTKQYEIWCNNKNFAGYALKYKNTHLEFVCTLRTNEAIKLID